MLRDLILRCLANLIFIPVKEKKAKLSGDLQKTAGYLEEKGYIHCGNIMLGCCKSKISLVSRRL